jgi:hypothetical protein
MGCTADKHSSQTGRREILTRGALQRRQLAGNKVANRLSATVFSQETTPSCAAVLCRGFRVWSVLLLKTNLLRPGCASCVAPRRIFFSIRGGNRGVQHIERLGHNRSNWSRPVAFPGLHENRLIKTPGTATTADGTVQKHGQKKLFNKITRARAVSLEAPASMTLIAAR